MNTYYECRVKNTEINNAGLEQVVNRPYLIDAVSYTDAETRIYKEISESVKGDFQVKSIKESNIKEIIGGFEGEWFWKVRIQMVSINENNGREQKLTSHVLVAADNAETAIQNTNKGLSYMLIPYTIEAVSRSPIAAVYEYDLEAAAAKLPESSERPEGVVFENDEESEGDDE